MEVPAVRAVGVFEGGPLAPGAVTDVKYQCDESCPGLSMEEPRVGPRKYDCVAPEVNREKCSFLAEDTGPKQKYMYSTGRNRW